MGLGGCRKNKVQAAPPVATPAPAPAEPAPTPPLPETKPEAKPEPQPPTLTVPPPKPAPAKPRPTAPPPEPAPTPEPAAPRPPAPQISPRLSPAEQAAHRERTNLAIETAEKNLQAVNGRKLTAAQNDLAAKVRGFLGQAREAIAASDWVRAQNLAQKAQLLSEELLRSLT
jgi:hypothetical protein